MKINKDAKKMLVKILAALAAIGSASLVIGGIMLLAGSSTLAYLGGMVPLALSISGTIMGILTIGVGVLYALLAIGLWNFRQWAWFAALVLSGIGVLSSVFHFNLFSLLLNAAVIWVLITTKKLFK